MLKRFTSRLETLYGDAEDYRRARALWAVFLILSIGVTVYFISLLLALPLGAALDPVVFAIALAMAVAILGGGIWMLFQGRLRLAAWIQAGGFWAMTVLSALSIGITRGALVSILTFMAMAALFLERGHMLVLTALYTLALLVVGLMQWLGLPFVPPVETGELIQDGGAAILGALISGVTLATLASQLSEAVRTSQTRARSLEALIKVGQTASSTLHLDEMLGATVERIQSEFGLNGVQIFLLEKDGDQASLRAGTAGSDQTPMVAVDLESAVGQAIKFGRPVILEDATRQPDRLRYHDLLPGTRSQAVIPMKVGSKVVGSLGVQAAAPGAFSQADVDIFQTLANQIAVTVETVQAFASEATVLETTSPLFRAMYDIGRATSPHEIVDALREYILQDIDRISLVQIGFGPIGEPLIETTTWDRDEVAVEAVFPAEVRQLVGNKRLVFSDVADMGEAEASLKAYAEKVLQARSLAIFPLIGRDRTAGYLVTASREPRAYSEHEVYSLGMLTGQVAVILENLSLLDAFSSQTARMSLISEISRSITGTIELDELGQLIVGSMEQLLPLTHLSVALHEPGKQNVELITLHGPQLPQEVALAGTRIEQAMTGRRAVQVNDVSEYPDGDLWSVAGVRSLIVAPVTVHERQLGTLNVGAAEMGGFTLGDVALCRQVATQLAASLENKRLVDRLQAALEETSTLYSTSLAMNAAQSVEEVYDTALGEIAHLSRGDRIVLYLGGPDPHGTLQHIEAVATWQEGKTIVDAETRRYPLDTAPILSQFPQSRGDLVFNNIRTDRRLDEQLRASYAEAGVNALMMVPLATGATWLGAVLAEALQGQTFDSEQVRLCRNVADQAALAIDSHLLLNYAQRMAGRETALREITERIRAADKVDAVLQIAADDMTRLVGGSIGELNPDEQELVESISNQVALAVENLNLIESTRRTAFREQLVSELTAQLQRTGSVEDVLAITARTLQSVLTDYDITLRLAPQAHGVGLQPGPDMPGEGVDDSQTA